MCNIWDRTARRQHGSFQRTCAIESLESRIALSGTPPAVVDVEVSSTQWSPAYVAYLANHSMGTLGGYSIPVGSTAQTANLPWNNLDQIKIKFNQDVNIQAADLSLSGKNTSSYRFSNFIYDPQTLVATWTLPSALTKDRLQIDLDGDGIAPVTNLNGDILDGEWTNNSHTYSSGNGTAGGDFEFLLNVLPGDVNNSGQVTNVDYVNVRALDGKTTTSSGYNAKYDINGSGAIDSTDWQGVTARLYDSLPTGNPAGVGNDAPSTSGFAITQITNDAIDVAISLLTGFADAESGATGLTYAIHSDSNPSLFDSVTINQSTHSLVVNAATGASGRANFIISATDAGGLTTDATVTVDVNHINQPPVITPDLPQSLPAGAWVISALVSDPDDDMTGMIVTITGDAFNTRAVVQPDHTIEFTIVLDDDATGYEYMVTADPHGLASNIGVIYIGLT
jgi:hypothetical protein